MSVSPPRFLDPVSASRFINPNQTKPYSQFADYWLTDGFKMKIAKTRRLSRRSLQAISVLPLLMTPVLAADLTTYQPVAMPYAPAFDWTGFHIGVSGGYAFDGHDASYTYNGVAPEEVAILPSAASLSSNGGIVGGNIG
jgi:hypothetical protein